MLVESSFAMLIAGATVFFGVLVKLVGIPDQIQQNFRRKSTEGGSFPNQLIGFIAYIFWTLHGILHHDPVLFYGQLLGVFVTGILLYQFSVYRTPKADRSSPTQRATNCPFDQNVPGASTRAWEENAPVT
jgi:uncharacterized protein with PQ loop repeat